MMIVILMMIRMMMVVGGQMAECGGCLRSSIGALLVSLDYPHILHLENIPGWSLDSSIIAQSSKDLIFSDFMLEGGRCWGSLNRHYQLILLLLLFFCSLFWLDTCCAVRDKLKQPREPGWDEIFSDWVAKCAEEEVTKIDNLVLSAYPHIIHIGRCNHPVITRWI